MPLPLYRPPPSIQTSPQMTDFKKSGPCWIAIAAGKGGVGKSTVTLQLARCLARGKRVGILDADLYGPSMRHMLPEDALPGRKNGRLTPARCGEMRLISLAYFRPEQEATAVRAPIANQLISHFLQEVDWEECDLILVDFPPGTGDIQLSLCQQIRFAGAILVTTPQLLALLDVRKTAHFFQQMHVPLLGVVENMSYYIDPTLETTHYPFGKEGGKQLSSELGVPCLGSIPLSPALCEACDLGRSLFEETSIDGKIAQKACEAIATRLSAILDEALKRQDPLHEVHEMTFPTPGMMRIRWKDDTESDISLRTLQRHCPCAACVMRKSQAPQEIEGPQAPLLVDRVAYMGHYGLRFDFQSGCCSGLYPFSLIRSL